MYKKVCTLFLSQFITNCGLFNNLLRHRYVVLNIVIVRNRYTYIGNESIYEIVYDYSVIFVNLYCCRAFSYRCGHALKKVNIIV
jgi:hypothetical protein